MELISKFTSLNSTAELLSEKIVNLTPKILSNTNGVSELEAMQSDIDMLRRNLQFMSTRISGG
jgi:hypothetical protein